MRLLAIHADFMEYETKKKTKFAEELTEEGKKRVEEVLVIFTSVEKEDEGFKDEITKRYLENLKEIADQLQTNRILIYPYVHLTSSPSNPAFAQEVFKELEDAVGREGYEVYRSPFGWYKSFNLKAKGHPLSEWSREIRITEEREEEEKVSDAVKAEETLKSQWYIIDVDGSLHEIKSSGEDIEGYDFGDNDNLKAFCNYEMMKSRTTGTHPPHIDLMRQMELVDYEPASDPGNFRYYPKGKLIKTLLERYVTQKTKEYGGMEIESPMMYDLEHPALKKYVNRFPARQYTIQTPDKMVFLRFAACFGQFLMMHDATISYKQLPLKLYELAHYSFRVEQRGELAGLRRLRAFTMPDCHAFCADVEMAKDELKKRFELSREIMSGIGFEIPGGLEFAIRVTKQFYDENKEFIEELVMKWGRPTLLEIWSERFFYFIFKYEWNSIDALGKAATLNTDQLDVENGELYDINYTGKDGKKHHPLILHQSPSGAIERVIYAILEKQAIRMKRGEKGELPFWLSPTQVRLIPVSEEFIPDCEGIADQVKARVDIDDRDEKVARKIRDAEKEWIGMIVVYGAKEKESDRLPVRLRSGEIREYTLEELEKEVGEKLEGFPFEGLTIPRALSKRPIFRG
jgi:threonyl-tRNA synthetase